MKFRYILIMILLLICYILIGGTLPYRKNPPLSEEFTDNFSVEDFYGKDEGPDRAKVIIDNGEALQERIRLIDRQRNILCYLLSHLRLILQVNKCLQLY